MSKWTIYQLLIIALIGSLVTINRIFQEPIRTFFSFVDSFLPPSILILFISVILIGWSIAGILLLQERKGKPMFTHPIWRIMPAVSGFLFLISFTIFLALGLTVLSSVDASLFWVIDCMIIYSLSLFYVFILSLFIRYGKIGNVKNKIISSANATVLVLIFVILFLPRL